MREQGVDEPNKGLDSFRCLMRLVGIFPFDAAEKSFQQL